MGEASFTPGPWRWYGNRGGGVYLATEHSGRLYVMGFQRYGMNGAQPTFRVANIMRPAAELVEFAVGDGTARGFKQADKDSSVYRYDVDGIDCPDARLIASAPELYDALKACAEVLYARIPRLGPEGPDTVEQQSEYEEIGGAWSMATRALAKANGETAT